ncbi:MAG: hypothetical protein ACXVHV_10135, partial [Methanobacterium sp.]
MTTFIIYMLICYRNYGNGYTSLVWALTFNDKLKLELFGTYQNNPRYLSYLDNLIFELKKFDCKNIQEKIKDADNLYKFSSTVSELEIANFLVENGKKVQLLPDSYFDSKSPDILRAYPKSIVTFTRV